MPIILYENIPFVVSRSEFLSEYKKLETINQSNINLLKGFDFGISVSAITEIFIKSKELHKDDSNSRVYSFNFYEKDAIDITLELLLFFSKFYFRLKILDSNDCFQNIKEYILPQKEYYLKEDSSIKIQDGKMSYHICLNQIKQIQGLVNNFVICTNNQLIHFCSDVSFGKRINIISVQYNCNSVKSYGINDFDYVLERNMPSKFKLWRYREKGFLIVIR